ncbi:hypothetical protein Q31b_45660 [Novipirellula aureliae]|uniref:Uncharacterized protein n=1 Tax=Novipirellula aureliae TaxID=2527966 RepID=A0A5C6DPG5_9BACT|nr:hypothetical protein [Novipirellula aureliae]TWU37777.1 hypothetical protein Q31b_45660 [Novipirellula aureliae]
MPENTDFLSWRRLATVAMILLGLGLVFYFGNRTVESYRQVRFIQEQGFDSGDADLDAIRPWMTIHFVAAAYAVPKEYIYAELGIDPDRNRRDIDLRRLNDDLKLGHSSPRSELPLIKRLRNIILDYRADPVATGLSELRDWMTLEYVANSTGIPASTIVDDLGLDDRARELSAPNGSDRKIEVNVHRPLFDLARDLHYPGGPGGLGEAIERVIAERSVEPQ